MPLIFKYFSQRVIESVFVREGFVGVKCSFPQDYNDPFELFLGIDMDQGSDLLATYKEVVQEIPSLLTTCFSRSPVVAPMWAHYGNNHHGFVVGFDSVAMESHFKDLIVRDIAYRDSPSEDLSKIAMMAARRCKPRDAMALRDAVYYNGYFSKYSEWSYEQEARAINLDDYVEDVNGNRILYIPASCITDVICGNNADQKVRETLLEFSDALQANFYIEKIGRSYPRPFLISAMQNTQVFAEGEIRDPIAVCTECSEPLKSESNLCPWCSIDENDESIAASVNSFRIHDGHGLLQQYFENYPRADRKPYKGS